MATLSNRSQYTVRVPRRADLERTFSHEDLNGARKYLNELRQDGHVARLEQADEHWYGWRQQLLSDATSISFGSCTLCGGPPSVSLAR